MFYLTDISNSWREVDWTTYKIIKACKGEAIRGSFFSDVTGVRTRYTADNVRSALLSFCGQCAAKLNRLTEAEFTIVPVPNSGALVGEREKFRTERIADAIAARSKGFGSVAPVLRWREPRQKAHEGGSRSARALEENLVILSKPQGEVVLFDDVLTTGGHMEACYRRLQKSGIHPSFGLVLGRSTKEQMDKPLEWAEHTVDVWV